MRLLSHRLFSVLLNNWGYCIFQGLALRGLFSHRSWILFWQLKWHRLLHLFEELIKALGLSRGRQGRSWLDKLLRGRSWAAPSQVCKHCLCVACLPFDVCSQFFEVVVAHWVAPFALSFLLNKILVIIIEVDRSTWSCRSICYGLLYVRIIYLHLVSAIILFFTGFLFFRFRFTLVIFFLFLVFWFFFFLSGQFLRLFLLWFTLFF